MMTLGGFVFGKVLPGTCPVAGENPPSNQINNDFAAKYLQLSNIHRIFAPRTYKQQ
jgi:hypothetical protein